MKNLVIISVGVLIMTQGALAADGKWESTIAAGATVTSGNSDTLAANASINKEWVRYMNFDGELKVTMVNLKLMMLMKQQPRMLKG